MNQVYFLWSPDVKDEGLMLYESKHIDLIDALKYYLVEYPSSQDLYYLSYYELISEGLILPDASVLNPYLRKLLKQAGDVPLVLTPV